MIVPYQQRVVTDILFDFSQENFHSGSRVPSWSLNSSAASSQYLKSNKNQNDNNRSFYKTQVKSFGHGAVIYLKVEKQLVCTFTLHDMLKKRAALLIQSEVKPEPITTRLIKFSRAFRQPQVFTKSFDWFI